jgi:hypothetical protein
VECSHCSQVLAYFPAIFREKFETVMKYLVCQLEFASLFVAIGKQALVDCFFSGTDPQNFART